MTQVRNIKKESRQVAENFRPKARGNSVGFCSDGVTKLWEETQMGHRREGREKDTLPPMKVCSLKMTDGRWRKGVLEKLKKGRGKTSGAQVKGACSEGGRSHLTAGVIHSNASSPGWVAMRMRAPEGRFLSPEVRGPGLL